MRSNIPLRTRLGAICGAIVVALTAVVTTAIALAGGLSPVFVVGGWVALCCLHAFLPAAKMALWRRLDETTGPADGIETVRLEVASLSDALDVRSPDVTVLDWSAPLAMIAGTPVATRLAITTELFEAAAPDERRALLAHELAHAAHRDVLVSGLVAAVANGGGLAVWWWVLRGAPSTVQLAGVATFQLLFLARSYSIAMVLVVLLGGLVPLLVPVAFAPVSRYQEYRADAIAASLVGDPRPVVRALATLDVRTRTIEPAGGVDAVPDTGRGWFDRLIASHPPQDRRIDRLLASMESG